ncbi:MAG: hypothetical protein RIA64_01290 [Rhodospirillales bacterium]
MKRKRHPRRVYLGILKRQRLICACGCGVKITRAEGFQFDHGCPIWAGGGDTPEDIQAFRDPCHKAKTAAEATMRAKADRIRAKSAGDTGPRGGKRRKAKIQSRGFDSRFKKKLNGEVVAR